MITQIVILKQLLTFPKEVIYFLYFLSFLPLFNNYNLLIGRVL